MSLVEVTGRKEGTLSLLPRCRRVSPYESPSLLEHENAPASSSIVSFGSFGSPTLVCEAYKDTVPQLACLLCFSAVICHFRRSVRGCDFCVSHETQERKFDRANDFFVTVQGFCVNSKHPVLQ